MWPTFYYRAAEILFCCSVIVNFIPKVWKRIRIHAKEYLKNLKNVNYHSENAELVSDIKIGSNRIEGKVLMLTRQWEDNQMFSQYKQNVINTTNESGIIFESNLNDLRWSQISDNHLKETNLVNPNRKDSISLNGDEFLEEYDLEDKENHEKSCNNQRRRSTVSEIARIFEKNGKISKIHMASKANDIAGNYFERYRATTTTVNGGDSNQKQQQTLNENSNELKTSDAEVAINKVNSLEKYSFGQMINHHHHHHEEKNSSEDKVNCSSSSSSSSPSLCENVKQSDVIKNGNYSQEVNEPLQNSQFTISNEEKQSTKGNSSWSLKFEEESELDATITPTNETPLSSLLAIPPLSTATTTSSSSSSSLVLPSEVKLRNHGKVQTVEEILKEQRFSRRLSAYSISEYLKDFPNEADIDEMINNIGK